VACVANEGEIEEIIRQRSWKISLKLLAARCLARNKQQLARAATKTRKFRMMHHDSPELRNRQQPQQRYGITESSTRPSTPKTGPKPARSRQKYTHTHTHTHTQSPELAAMKTRNFPTTRRIGAAKAAKPARHKQKQSKAAKYTRK